MTKQSFRLKSYTKVCKHPNRESKRKFSQTSPTNAKESFGTFSKGLLFLKKRRLPTLPRVCSTIGADGLNFSVRNGKRWNPDTITT